MTEHEHIEAEEDARERDFEGLASDAPLDTDRAIADPLDSHAHGSQDHILTGEDPESHQVPFKRPQGSSQGRPARIERTKPKPEDLNKLKAEVEQGHGGIWGAWGEKDMMRPRNDKERMRKNTPYSKCLQTSCSCIQRLIYGWLCRVQDGTKQRILMQATPQNILSLHFES